MRLWWIVSEIAYTYNSLKCEGEREGRISEAPAPLPPPHSRCTGVHGVLKLGASHTKH